MAAIIEYKKREIHVFLDGEIDHHSASLIRASIDDAIIGRAKSIIVLMGLPVSIERSFFKDFTTFREVLCIFN